jgi:very-short-patch-repair endonuclease
LALLAHRQHGVLASRQLDAIGVTQRMLERRVASGHLLRLHRGVYAVGHRRLTREGRWLAAVLACGTGAVLSHHDAAALHEIVPPVDSLVIQVSSAARRASQRGIALHGRRALGGDDVTIVRGIPVATIARTLVDVASTPRLRKAVNEAERLGLLDAEAVLAALARTRGRHDAHAAARLERELARVEAVGWQLTRSDLEDALDVLVDEHALPPPLLNARIAGGEEVDAVWPAQRVAVEVDGWDAHRGRVAFQRDRTKSNALTLAGWTVLRFTWTDVTRRPRETAAHIRTALGRRAAA